MVRARRRTVALAVLAIVALTLSLTLPVVRPSPSPGHDVTPVAADSPGDSGGDPGVIRE